MGYGMSLCFSVLVMDVPTKNWSGCGRSLIGNRQGSTSDRVATATRWFLPDDEVEYHLWDGTACPAVSGWSRRGVTERGRVLAGPALSDDVSVWRLGPPASVRQIWVLGNGIFATIGRRSGVIGQNCQVSFPLL